MKFINGFTAEKVCDIIDKEFKGMSANEDGECQYFCEDGRRCALGLFIPEELYSDAFEGNTSYGLLRKWPKLKSHMPFENDVLSWFQDTHDGALDERMSLDEQKRILKEFVRGIV